MMNTLYFQYAVTLKKFNFYFHFDTVNSIAAHGNNGD
jgi:hypothetical protein